MANYNFTFEEVVRCAETQGYEHRGEPSRAHDYTQTYWRTFNNNSVMVLYEGKKRKLRGHDKEEVCWICVYEDGSFGSVPSRYFRKHFIELAGFDLNNAGKQVIADIVRNFNNNDNNN